MFWYLSSTRCVDSIFPASCPTTDTPTGSAFQFPTGISPRLDFLNYTRTMYRYARTRGIYASIRMLTSAASSWGVAPENLGMEGDAIDAAGIICMDTLADKYAYRTLCPRKRRRAQRRSHGQLRGRICPFSSCSFTLILVNHFNVLAGHRQDRRRHQQAPISHE